VLLVFCVKEIVYGIRVKDRGKLSRREIRRLACRSYLIYYPKTG